MPSPQSPPQTPQKPLSWHSASDEVKDLLQKSTQYWEDNLKSEQYMNQALEKAGDNFDVLVSAYRYFFYKNKNDLALKVATQVLDQVRREKQLPSDWSDLEPILCQHRDEPVIRLYINAYSAVGLIQARLGHRDLAQEISSRVKAIDDRNEFGGSTIFNILTQPLDEDD